MKRYSFDGLLPGTVVYLHGDHGSRPCYRGDVVTDAECPGEAEQAQLAELVAQGVVTVADDDAPKAQKKKET